MKAQTVTVKITADASQLVRALARAERPFIERLIRRGDPSPFPRLRLFRWLP